jgi:hypothetical protein
VGAGWGELQFALFILFFFVLPGFYWGELQFARTISPGFSRVSLGIGNTDEEIDCLIRSLNLMAGKNGTINSSKTNGKPVLTNQEVKKKLDEFVADSSLKVCS